eukprot:m.31180 g.31180  ORF g.31180 m.31180 type:complete len:460 (+) comp31460_c0_seq3:51-1430(+)
MDPADKKIEDELAHLSTPRSDQPLISKRSRTKSFYLPYFRLTWFRRWETTPKVAGLILTGIAILGFLGRIIFFSPYIHTIFRDDAGGHADPARINTNVYAINVFFILARFIVSLIFAILAWIGNWSEVSWRPPVRISLLVLIGFLNYVSLLLLTYASPPTRTKPELQPILGASVVVYTVILQRVLLRKKISWPRLLCTGVVLVGLVVTLIPTFGNFGESSTETNCNYTIPPCESGSNSSACEAKTGTLSSAANAIWTVVFLIAFIPRAVLVVLARKELQDKKGKDVHLAIFMVYVNLIILVCVLLSFWVCFIPEVATPPVSSVGEIGDLLRQGLSCSFGHMPTTVNGTSINDLANSSCILPAAYGWTAVVGNNFAAMGSFMLVKHASDAVYSMLVSALATPIGAVLWILIFLTCEARIDFSPYFDHGSACVIGGLVLVVPGVVIYKALGRKPPESQQVN